jgi:two-component system, NtrC family, response regulator AtoC
MKEMSARPYQSVFCGMALAEELLGAVRALDAPPVVIVTAPDLRAGLGAVDQGAFDCLVVPVEPLQLALALRRLAALESFRREPRAAPRGPARPAERAGEIPQMAGMVGASRSMREVFQIIEKIAQHKASVMICGESGTGKELVARAIHDLGPRRHKRFVAVNCGAIPGNLLESELFGHRRGAFTDAIRDKPGLFETADDGTLFLDEIGELPLNLQVKLLRAIQEEEIRRIGDNSTIKVDVRLIAATLRDLSKDVAAGRFREDLYYRLNVVPVTLPPLRERREDIPYLVEHFIRKHAGKHADRITGVSEEAMALLRDYSWPGNIRELENTIERAMVLCDGSLMGGHLFADKIGPTIERPGSAPDPESRPEGLSLKKATRAVEVTLIRKALEVAGGHRLSAAKLLEISHRALLYKLKEYGL